jgi:hypothetical protein
MLKNLILVFAVVALVVASAGTVVKGNSYRITLMQPSVVKGTVLKAGDYKITVLDSKITIANGKDTLDVPVTIETVDKKYDDNAIRYSTVDGKAVISEIRLGGTKTKLVLNP